jgi:2-polyprenyl-3-methyl-5-hydroxy-6-metoxy-1,4-benzoquinol methylase
VSDTTELQRAAEFQAPIDDTARRGPIVLGPFSSFVWRCDPRRMGIVLARYKFVAKMLSGSERVLEVGCGDGFYNRIVLQTVKHIHGIDIDPEFIAWANEHSAQEGLNSDYQVLDVINGRIGGKYEGAYLMDVIEHISLEDEARFMGHIVDALEPDGTIIVGTPNITASPYASIYSQQGHINLKSAETLRASLEPFFKKVFLFSMNDEVVHTGFYPMAHYLIGMGVGRR